MEPSQLRNVTPVPHSCAGAPTQPVTTQELNESIEKLTQDEFKLNFYVLLADTHALPSQRQIKIISTYIQTPSLENPTIALRTVQSVLSIIRKSKQILVLQKEGKLEQSNPIPIPRLLLPPPPQVVSISPPFLQERRPPDESL